MLFRPTSIALAKYKAKPKSTTAWVASQYENLNVKGRLSNSRSYRSPSAFRLLKIEAKWGRFLSHSDVHTVIDLGAAPGGWSQVAAGKLGWHIPQPIFIPQSLSLRSRSLDGDSTLHKFENDADYLDPQDMEDIFDPRKLFDLEDDEEAGKGRGMIVAMDLFKVSPIRGVRRIQADFLSPDAEALIHEALIANVNSPDGKVDVVLSDMAVVASGNHIQDVEANLRLCHTVFEFARRRLRSAKSIGRKRGGVLLMRHLAHPLMTRFRIETLVPHFHDVRYIRLGSDPADVYFLCQGWKSMDTRVGVPVGFNHRPGPFRDGQRDGAGGCAVSSTDMGQIEDLLERRRSPSDSHGR